MTALPVDLQELREAVRALIRAYGGQDAVASRFGVAQQRVGQMLNSDRLLPLPWIAQMEAATRGLPGHPHVTTALARNVDRLTVARPNCDAIVSNLPAAVMAISAELGDVSRCLAEGLSDGVMCADDIAAAERELLDLEQQTASLRAALRQLKAEARA